MRRLLWFALTFTALRATPSHALECAERSFLERVADATWVAEVEVIDVADRAPRDVAPLRVRVVRVFLGPEGLDDGDETTLFWHAGQDHGFSVESIGERHVLALHRRHGHLAVYPCSGGLDPRRPLPAALVDARRHRLRRGS
ncbi:MAG: hypothetical protein H6724_10100 [Sandaracinus sp.]|nr:hypothetical protein [Sandaracinus sp.]MCB9619784.1 hypothetical protein [Sandaracinus sp.]